MFFEIFQMSLFNPIEVAFEREDSTLDLVISIHVEFRFGRVFVKIPQENPIRSTLVIVLLKRDVLDLFYRFSKLDDRHSLFWSKQSMRKHQ